MLRIKKEDTVYVVAGKDKGKTGKVMKVFVSKSRALVEGINRVKKHVRKKREDQKTGIVEVEASIHVSNLQLYCKSCSKPSRVGILVQEDETRPSKVLGQSIPVDTSKSKAGKKTQDTIAHKTPPLKVSGGSIPVDKQKKTRLRICKRCKEVI